MDRQTSETNRVYYSVIIPAYNAEKTIERAIASVEKNLCNYEIIVAENGSTDNTAILVETLYSNNERIRIIHTEKGVSTARNAGIREAKGDWVVFLDSDDIWIASEESIKPLTETYTDAEVISCSYYKGDSLIELDFRYFEDLLDKELIPEATVWMLRSPTKTMSVWAKFFKREFLQKQRLLFNEELRVSEDSEFLLRCMLKSTSVIVSKLPVYRYCIDMPSVIRSIDTTRTEGYLKALRVAKNDLKGTGEVFQDAFVDFTAAHLYLIGVHDIFNWNMRVLWKDRISKIKEIVNQDIVRAEIDKLKIRKLININNMPSFLFKKRMYSLGGAMCYIRSAINSIHWKTKKRR